MPCRGLRFATVGICASLLLAACHRTPDETRIRNTLDAMVSALGAHDNRAFLEHVSDAYHDHEGRDLQGLRQLLLANFAQHRNIKLFISGLTVAVQGNRADVRFQARLTSGEQLIEDRRFGAYRVGTLWARHGNDWLVYRAEWEPVDTNP